MNDPQILEIEVEDMLCFAIYSANHAMNRFYQPLLKELGLTYPQYLALLALWRKNDQTVGELGETLFLESNTLTPLIKRLEALGHVTRMRDPKDERQVRVSLTPQGRSLEAEAACVPEKALKASGGDKTELAALRDQLLDLRRRLERADRP